jgi:hypothetical protein
VSAGITLGITIPGLVPFFEEHDARLNAGYTLPAWQRMTATEKALEVAMYRLRHAKASHEQAAQAKYMKGKRRKRR